MSDRQRLVFVAQHPIHYHAVLYRRAAQDPSLDSCVYFMQEAWAEGGYEPEFGQRVDWGVPITDGFRHRFFRNLSPFRNGDGVLKFFNPGLVWAIFAGPRATVYIHGMNYLTHIGCMLAAVLSGKRLILRTITYDVTKPRGLKGFVRNAIYRLMFKLPSAFLYIGKHNRDFFVNHGVAQRKLVHAPHVVDNAFFAAKDAALREQDVKARLGLAADDGVIAFVGKMSERKQCSALFQAFVEADLGPKWTLVFVGTGDKWDELHALAADTAARVIFTGFLNQIELCDIYKITDIFALPSLSETWGLVVNEAQNFGCAVVASDKVGCAPDLVEGRSGLIHPAGDVAALAGALRRLALDPALLEAMQAGARRTIAQWDVEHYIAGLKRAIAVAQE
ncbi:MAG: glycosyltransferase family 4 protein [Rhizomicrobium sp.]